MFIEGWAIKDLSVLTDEHNNDLQGKYDNFYTVKHFYFGGYFYLALLVV